MKSILFLLVSYVAVTSTLSGLLMISDPEGSILNLSLSLLDGTPFKNYLLPGILLTILVGGINFLAIFFLMEPNSNRYNWSMSGGSMITGWTIAQIILVQAVHWLNFLYLGIGVLIILLSYQLKGKWAV